MPGLRQDTVAKLDLDSNMSNKERFEKLKESRQKYKDEAKAAKDRCEALEQQLKMLVAQMESEDASAAAGAGASAAAENESLKAQLAEAREECARLEKVVLERSQAMQRATMEANEWRKKAERAAKAKASATGAAATTTTTDAAAYAYGALLGAGVVAGIGYVALTYGMKR